MYKRQGLHYYRLDGILIGSVEPIDGLTEASTPETPTAEMDMELSDVTNGNITGEGVVLGSGGEMMTEQYTIFPGRYRVTLTGSGFDHSYISVSYTHLDVYKRQVSGRLVCADADLPAAAALLIL